MGGEREGKRESGMEGRGGKEEQIRETEGKVGREKVGRVRE